MAEVQPTARMPENASGDSINSAKRPPLSRWIGGAVILAALIGALYYLYFSKGPLSPGNIAEINAGAVALVNGEKILRGDYDERLIRETAVLRAGGVDTALEQEALKQQVLDNLIAEILILQEASRRGVAASDEEVNLIIAENQTRLGSEDAFQKTLEAENFTLEKFRKLVFNQLTIQKILEADIDFSGIIASEEEIRAYYEQSIAGSEAYPRLEEVRGQIESFVIQNKQQELIAKFVQSLRSNGKIETML